jgi:tetratricopeptide (TPR) repeat protein
VVRHDRKTPVAPAPPGLAERDTFFPPPSAPDAAPPPSQARPAISSVPPRGGEDWSEAEAQVGPRRSSPPPAAPLPWQNLEGLRVRDGDTADLRATGGGARSRWILALVLLGGLALIAATVGRDYLSKNAPRASAQPKLDERVPALVAQGRALLDRGDFENANAELAKAGMLAENEPSVAAAEAELELARVDLLWIHREIRRSADALAAAAVAKAKEAAGSPPAAPASTTSAPMGDGEAEFQRRLTEQLNEARNVTDKAQSLAPDALPVLRARVDLLRISGDLKGARELVSRLSERASEAQNAYSLGALDLAEAEPGYTSAIARLRVAARNESALGRARSALILALAKTNDASQAQAELDKLRLIAPQHALLADLTTLVGRVAAPPPPPPAPTAAPEPSAAAPAREPPPKAAPAPKPAPVSRTAADARLVERAQKLQRGGDLFEAEQIYQQVLRSDSGNVPALYGLGEIARQRRATATATAFYEQVLRNDPDHLPTIMARADMLWQAGQQAEAVRFYRRGLARTGSSTPFGTRALARIEEYERGAPATPRPSSPAPSEPEQPKASGDEPALEPGGAAPAGLEPAPTATASAAPETPPPANEAPAPPESPTGSQAGSGS